MERSQQNVDAAGGARILVVDDNRDAARSLALLLKMAGHQTHVATDGAEAVEAAERFKPHAVLLDIGLPTLDGYEAARRIRQLAGAEATTLVALTGRDGDDAERLSHEAGFDAHLVKPVNMAALTELLAARLPG